MNKRIRLRESKAEQLQRVAAVLQGWEYIGRKELLAEFGDLEASRNTWKTAYLWIGREYDLIDEKGRPKVADILGVEQADNGGGE